MSNKWVDGPYEEIEVGDLRFGMEEIAERFTDGYSIYDLSQNKRPGEDFLRRTRLERGET